MTDREKLSDLLYEASRKADSERNIFDQIADHLIAHGVTVQEWIPASEPPQKGGEYLCRCIVNDMDDMPFYMVLRYYIVDENPHFQHEQKGGMRVTHWRAFGRLEKPEPGDMPQPPKGE